MLEKDLIKEIKELNLQMEAIVFHFESSVNSLIERLNRIEEFNDDISRSNFEDK